MRRYARETVVSVDKSRIEVEKLLTKYGATSFMFGTNQHESVVAFEIASRQIKFTLPLPDVNDVSITHGPGGNTRNENQVQAAFEQAIRSRWRALVLVLKAKLEAVAVGIVTMENEFMAHIVMPDGLTVGQHVAPRIAQAYETGTVVPLLGDPKP